MPAISLMKPALLRTLTYLPWPLTAACHRSSMAVGVPGFTSPGHEIDPLMIFCRESGYGNVPSTPKPSV